MANGVLNYKIALISGAIAIVSALLLQVYTEKVAQEKALKITGRR